MKYLAHALVLVSPLALASWSFAQQASTDASSLSPSSLSQRAEQATAELTKDNEYLLRYQFTKGEQVRWKVVHVATTKTTMKGNTQESRSRSVSTKVWEIDKVDSKGNATIVHSIADVDMLQQVTDRPAIRYSSKSDEEVPPLYLGVAKTVGVPMFQVTVNALGRVLIQKSLQEDSPNPAQASRHLTIPLPEEAVKVGAKWHLPEEVPVRLQSGQVKKVRTRQTYELKKVQTGVATIDVNTVVLTPVNDPKIKVKLMQRLTHGTVKFDLDAGRTLHKELDWDETVLNFSGSDSQMEYVAEFTELLLKEKPEATARKLGPLKK